MEFFDFFKIPDINQEIKTYKETAGAILLDVRTLQEYREGHIPGSRNIPLQSIQNISSVIPQKDTPLFVYCHSGNRSRQAVDFLTHMGYTNAKNSGGLISYTGEIEN
ncbi:MAG: rhodanese-like domain-containing protein [Eubacteriales bacterium]|nr:rhodanese-like domain-containing protein [Eubacteriales bacterium]